MMLQSRFFVMRRLSDVPFLIGNNSHLEERVGVFRLDADSPSIDPVPTIQGFLFWSRKASAHCVQTSSLPILALLIFFAPVAAAAHSIPGQPNLNALFAMVGQMHNIDPDLLEAIAEVESGGDPLSVSPKGALGLMQLMPATASAFSVLDPFNPIANVTGAADFLDYLRDRLANNLNLRGLPTLLAAYNAGPGAVEKYGGIPPYAETHKYVQRVIERYANNLSTKTTVTPVLILGPKPYIIRLRPGPNTMQPEPVLINPDGNDAVPNQLTVLRQKHGYFVAAMGTGSAPWMGHAAARNHIDFPRDRTHKQAPHRSQFGNSQYLH
jgi:transglycosylase-like protein with SLT domain